MKTFKYEIEVNGIEYSSETVESLFGKGAIYEPDFREDCIAGEVLYDAFKYAIQFLMESKMNLLIKTKISPDKMTPEDKAYWNYLEDKIKKYEEIRDSIKLIV